jgi:hypothetical protein
MHITRTDFEQVYHRLNARFDHSPTDVVRNCYDRVMAYGRRHKLLPWFYQ